MALKQSDRKLQEMYHRDYHDRAKDVIELLLCMKEEDTGIQEIERVIHALKRLGTCEMSTDKIKLVLSKHVQPVRIFEPCEIDRSALEQLQRLAELLPHYDKLNQEVL